MSIRATLKFGRYNYIKDGKKKTVEPGKSIWVESKEEIPKAFHDQWNFAEVGRVKEKEKPPVKKTTGSKRTKPVVKSSKTKKTVSKKKEEDKPKESVSDETNTE